MSFSSTYAEEGHDHDDRIHPLHEAMHKNLGGTQIVIGGLAYADCSHRIGVCDLLYHEGHANQEAKRWGFFLPKLPVKLVEFENEILNGINNKCYSIDSWKKDLWAKVVEDDITTPFWTRPQLLLGWRRHQDAWEFGM